MAQSSPSPPPQPRRTLGSFVSSALSPAQLYVLVAALLVLSAARLFYDSLHLQTEHVGLWFSPQAFDEAIRGTRLRLWSAPLDDVFIHFDFARATARGYPFEWSEGNGYSSGGTSLLYPFVLAFGYLLGYRGLALGIWAAVVACVATFAILLAARRLFRNLPEASALLAPPLFLSTGVLNWSLFSGMEVALFLALWGLCFVTWDDFVRSVEDDSVTRLGALSLGLTGALLVATRPEAATLVAAFGLSAAWMRRKKASPKSILATLLWVGIPGVLVLVAHMVANKVLTGDSSAAGALAKLEIYHPYLTRTQAWDAWLFHVAYQVRRVSEYHFSVVPGLGYVIWLIALLSVVFERTRRYGVLLWTSLILWILVTALNGQVRWQNERYAMPAVAWLLLAAALGIAGAIDWAFSKKTTSRKLTLAPLAVAFAAFLTGQAPRLKEQVWFFGRASRNILEQHIRAGDYLRRFVSPLPRRVLVSDAGAIPFVSDLPAFDLIGLGGYGGYPIARASRQGVGAAVELIEHMPAAQRPDIMALYPSWWGTFTLWFGRPRHEFSVRGNVICGGVSKVIYEPDWSPIERSSTPFSLRPGERVVDTLDVADLLSEKPHSVSWNLPARGYVDMKMLPDPREADRDLWDAGRLLTPDLKLSFELRGFSQEPAALLLRVAPARPVTFEVRVADREPQRVEVAPADAWQEMRVELGVLPAAVPIEIGVAAGDAHLFHVFAVEGAGALPDGESAASSPAP